MRIRAFFLAALCLALPAALYSSTVLENTGSFTKGPLSVTVTYITVMNINPTPLMNEWNEVKLSADQDFIFNSATIYNENNEELFTYQRNQENPEDSLSRLFFKYNSSEYGDLDYLSLEVNLITIDSIHSETLDFDLRIVDNRYTFSEREETVLGEDLDFRIQNNRTCNIDLEADLDLLETNPE